MKYLRSVASRTWLVALILLSWQALSWFQVLDPLFFPPPSTLVSTLRSLITSGEAGQAIWRTLLRCGLGFSVGVLAGGVASAAFATLPWLRRASQPIISALYASPRLTLLPMVMLLLGLNDRARISLVALSTFLIVVIQVTDAVSHVASGFVDMAVNYGASRLMVIRKVYLPACLPQMFTALRLAFGRALVLTISIELLSANDGLGHLIWSSWLLFATEKLYASIALTATLGLLFEASFHFVERRLAPWSKKPA